MRSLLVPAILSAASVLAGAPAAARRPVEVVLAEGALALRRGELSVAAERFADVLETDPGSVPARRLLAAVRRSQGDAGGAAELLEEAVAARPEDFDLRIELGLAFLEVGNLAFAARHLAVAAASRPASARAQFLLGATLARQGDCSLASRHLREARRLDRELSAETGYLAGLCHARRGRMDEARAELEPFLRSEISSPLVPALRRLTRLALRAEGIQTAPFSGRIGLALGYDGNPTFAARGQEPLRSFAPAVHLDATVRPYADATHTIAGRLLASRIFELPEPRAADYGFTLLAGAVYYRLRGRTGEARHELHAGYDFALGLFDGGPPLTDRRHLHSEHHGGRLAWTVRSAERHQTRLTLLVRHGTHARRGRNNIGMTVALGQAVSLAGGGVLLMVEGAVRVEDAASLDSDVVAPGILAALTWRAPWRLTLSAWALYEREDHPSSRPRRVDDSMTLSLTLERPITRHLAVSVGWLQSEAFSSVERFDIGRGQAALTLWGAI